MTADAPRTRPRSTAACASGPCESCLARSWLLHLLAGHFDAEVGRLEDVLALSNHDLIDALGGSRRDALAAEYAAAESASLRSQMAAAGLAGICRCDRDYPERLAGALAPPAVLYFTGDRGRFLELLAGQPVAIVGARRPSAYGLDVARSLGRDLARAGIPVISGMALGIDCSAHAGALDAEGPTLTVLPTGADRPYPAAKRRLYDRIRAHGAVASELAPGAVARRWTFIARNRVIAALSAMTIVVEAGERSGSLTTAGYARALGIPVGAVPGRVTSPLAAGSNELLANGAELIRSAQDVLDALFGAGARQVPGNRRQIDGKLRILLTAIAEDRDTVAALARAGLDAEQGLSCLSELELAGYIRREPGGRYSVVP